MNPTPRLTCQQCKTRKIRCDKRAPCSACESANINCNVVQRRRLPRGRSGKAARKETLLENRVARIEKLLEQQQKAQVVSDDGRNQSSGPLSYTSTESCRSNPPPDKINEFVAPEFWSVLSEEVQGLRETLEGSASEDEEESAGYDEAGASMATMLFPTHNNVNDHTRALPVPTPQVRTRLLDLYHDRVDSVYKILHWPTALADIEAAHVDTTGILPSSAAKALEYSIYFMALCSSTEHEAESMGCGSKREVTQAYRLATEALLTKADLCLDPNLKVLQAFVIYLIGLRTCLHGALTWTLVAVAVRTATALRLGEELPDAFSPFDLELRRRLFFAIGILDTHSALDRGTVPILPSNAFRNPPLSIDDHDMSPDTAIAISSPGFTDMSFTAMTYEAMICQRRLYELSCDPSTGWESWDKKLKIVSDFGDSMRQIHARVDGLASPLQRFQRFSADKLVVSLQLMLRRPPYRQPVNAVPPWDDFDAMEVATNILEDYLLSKSADFAPWAWKTWLQWPALAVVLVELCGRPQGASSDRAYLIATEIFGKFAGFIADTKSGLLWKPIARLMRRVQRVRQSESLKLKGDVPNADPPTFADARSNPVPLHASSERNPNDLLATDPQEDPARLQQPSDSTHWSLGNDGFDALMDTGDHSWSSLYDAESAVEIPWISWDLFLQDANFITG